MTTYVITGANRGIGLELCKQLKEQGNKVIAACRKATTELTNLGVEVIEGIDVNEQESINNLAQNLQNTKIDVLINNAGVWGDEDIGGFDADKISSVIKTNAISPMMLTEALLDNLSSGSKVIMITSRMGSIADNESGGRYSYRMSKAALNAASKSLSIDLKDKDIAVGIIHPGHVATDMGGPQGIPVEESASNIIARINECDLSNTGRFMHANGEELPW